MKDDLSQKNMLFSVYMHKCYKYHITLLPKKNPKVIFSRKNTPKVDISGITENCDIYPIKCDIFLKCHID